MAPRSMPTQARTRPISRLPPSRMCPRSDLSLRFTLHHALTFHPDRQIPIVYDAACPPSSIAGSDISLGELRRYLAQKAITPMAECIVLENESLGRNITVRPGTAVDASSPYLSSISDLPEMEPSPPAQHLPSITVHNVLVAIHQAVTMPLSVTDFEALDSVAQAAITSAWVARCAKRDEKRRLDVLAAAGVGTRVAGLSASSRSDQVWNLHFA